MWLRACGSAELRKMASGSATQGFWLRDKKVGSLGVREDRSRLPGRGIVGEVKKRKKKMRKKSQRENEEERTQI